MPIGQRVKGVAVNTHETLRQLLQHPRLELQSPPESDYGVMLVAMNSLWIFRSTRQRPITLQSSENNNMSLIGWDIEATAQSVFALGLSADALIKFATPSLKPAATLRIMAPKASSDVDPRSRQLSN